jgi:hypothetical protein
MLHSYIITRPAATRLECDLKAKYDSAGQVCHLFCWTASMSGVGRGRSGKREWSQSTNMQNIVVDLQATNQFLFQDLRRNINLEALGLRK